VTYTSEFPFVYLSADVVAFSVQPDAGLSLLAVKRGSAPFKGRWAFPGGFVDENEDVARAARRELREETGVGGRWLRLEQIGAYAAPRRDPRHRNVSVAFLAVVGPGVDPTAGDDAADATWLPLSDLLPFGGRTRLAFDHNDVVQDGLRLLGTRMESTDLGLGLLAPTFTVAELRSVYEAVWDRSLDAGNFQRKVTSTPGLLRDTGLLSSGGRGRPAALFEAGGATEIWPPMSRDRDR
jgi:8-oxo-dGTP diphosphatase